jgi:hypothetical protein
MRKSWVLVIVLMSVMCVANAQTIVQDGPVITFEKKTHDFGEIVQGDKVEYIFTFTNTGNQPLIVTNVEVTCGCTTPKGWPRDPIQPGEKGELTVSFSTAGKIGRQNKPIIVISNAMNPDGNRLSFSATILEKGQLSSQ